jgi:outer membrane lipoprotein carrier protein
MRSLKHLVCGVVVGVALATSAFAQAPTPAAPAPVAAPTPQQTAQVVSDVQAFYNRTNTFSADFAQTYLVKAYNQTKNSSGHVVFAKPGKMDWNYTDPAGNRVVSDGTTLKAYEASNKQMYQQTVNQSQYPAALSFLTGTGQLSTLFNFTMTDGAALGFPNGWVLVGDPVTPTPAYTKVLFYVDKASSQVMRVLILDGQGNRNRFDFTNALANVALPATQFQYTPPAGTTVIVP